MSDEITVRRARPSDLAVLDGLMARTYPMLLKGDYPPSVLVTALPLISKAQPGLLRRRGYFVAELDGRVVGAGGWTPVRGTPGQGDIRHVATDLDALRRGVGQALINRTLDDARDRGITRMWCKSTRTAVPFYERMGFHVLGEIDMELRPGIWFPAVRMARTVQVSS